ncbi:MAG: HAD family hydrolase [Muribaculaceae bacterium]|nr:HAD family hydrolase [Muribaculaceae bacterium]
MKTLAIFDLDGTLLNTIQDLGAATNYALEMHSQPVHSIDAYERMVGNGVRKLIERALPSEYANDAYIDRLLVDFKQYYNDHMTDATRPYPGIPELLRELTDRGVAVAVASNKYESAVQHLMEHYFPQIPFAAVCGNLEGFPAKPDPSIVFRVLTEHPTPKAEVLYIGDSGVDMETARRACVDSVGVTWGFRPRRELVNSLAGTIVSEPSEILALL